MSELTKTTIVEIYVIGFSHSLSLSVKKPTLGQAHLVFADTKANAKKPKELALSHLTLIKKMI